MTFFRTEEHCRLHKVIHLGSHSYRMGYASFRTTYHRLCGIKFPSGWHGDAVFCAVASQQEGSVFKVASRLGPFFAEFTFLPVPLWVSSGASGSLLQPKDTQVRLTDYFLVLVCTRVRLLCSHLPKWLVPRAKRTGIQFNWMKKCRCGTSLRDTTLLIQIKPCNHFSGAVKISSVFHQMFKGIGSWIFSSKNI